MSPWRSRLRILSPAICSGSVLGAGGGARVRLLRATSLSQPGRPREVVEEIRTLVEAIAARDVDLAVRLCDAHLNKAAATGIKALETEAGAASA